MKIKLVSLLVLGACTLCACNPQDKTIPTDFPLRAEGEITTYLVLSSEGRYNGELGEDVPSLHLENTITYTAQAGSALPGKETITSTSKDVEFETWLMYEGNGSPTRVSEVPAQDGLILYAFFNYTGDFPLSGGGGGDDPVTETEYYVVGDGSFVTGPIWDPAGGIKMTPNPNPDPALTNLTAEYMALGIEFAKGDIWKLCSGDEVWWGASNWEQGESSIAKGDMKEVPDGQGGNNVEVVTAGTYDIYLKFYDDGGWSCWVQSSSN